MLDLLGSFEIDDVKSIKSKHVRAYIRSIEEKKQVRGKYR